MRRAPPLLHTDLAEVLGFKKTQDRPSSSTPGPTAASAQNLRGAIRLLREYCHNHGKLVLARGGHALAGSLYLTDGAVEVSQVTDEGPLVHCGEGDRASWSHTPSPGRQCLCLPPTPLPSIPLAARGTVGRS